MSRLDSDPLGLLVDGYFNVQQGVLTVIDRDSGASVTLRADSGERGTWMNNNPSSEPRTSGAIPRANYEILDRLYNKPDEWSDLDRMQAAGMGVWALDMLDSTQRDDHGRGHGALRLHPGWGTGLHCFGRYGEMGQDERYH